ncbi:MAG: acyl-ACP--UDP-N-acetylglucosamine O-acyltransferase [Gemmatimonadota bacterium]|jgi:UDP-N-acetylglucosamine acyltransferase|nr:acyl-ACP--UDP-N-acetylglucosamine O-acyltransferase [Gemmatimonadota bacterium]MDQ8162933.1 acyl-ACP--UDP-N-acetylglucosamine O-acyltransferase [Gemmatimonadota bacterium]MDQ8167456.1 acyl-ACP--UDP-N-acetylglucosamine O-acyltransferase [Gemmatimonadota bacterium]MDQ8171970.1 acyl-ACP--UDP-N-acetylglucosamine O-acyltransferase [Gemmatimonadota bacterium]
MTARIHPTALVDASAQLGNDVEVGPWAIIGPQCTVGNGTHIAARATLERNVRLGERVQIGSGAILGGDPQDLKYRGEETWVDIGDETAVREYATINRGTAHSITTSVGRNCFLMSYVHLAHDCHIGDNVIISNGTQLAGHVTVEDKATISGLCAVHQFSRIGRHSFIGGCSRVAQDVPPFVRAVGNPIKLFGLNSVGLRRTGFDEEVVRELKRAYRVCFRSDLNLGQGVERARAELTMLPDVQHFLDFIEASQRGVGF